MTLTDAQAQFDAILKNLGITKAEYQGRSVEYPSGDARLKELAYLDEYITKQTDLQNGTKTTRCTLASFRRG